MARKRKGEGQTALITGASSGIGAELAACFAKDGYRVILVARSGEALNETAGRLSAEHGVEAIPVVHDLGQIGAGQSLVQALNDKGLMIDVLVNNAGFGDAGAFHEADPHKTLGMIDLNVRVLTELCRLLMPAMIQRRQGGILNVASTAAFQPGPMMAVYYASKHYVLALTEALWEEARGKGIKISALCPGPVLTGFQERADLENERMFKFVPLTTAAYVARKGYGGWRWGRRTVIPGFSNWFTATAVRFTPKGIALRLARFLNT